MLLVFLLCAGVQWNDPDATPWVVIYLAAAGLCILSEVKRIFRRLVLLLGLVAMGWMIYLFPQILESWDTVRWADIVSDVKMKTVGVELVREFGGLLIVFVWMFILFIKSVPKKIL